MTCQQIQAVTSLTLRGTRKESRNSAVTKTDSISFSNDTKMLHKKWSQKIEPFWWYLMLKNQIIRLEERILRPRLKNQTVELLQMAESNCCCFYACLPICKNQHHCSIQSWHIADSILGITFDMPRCTKTHPHEQIESK